VPLVCIAVVLAAGVCTADVDIFELQGELGPVTVTRAHRGSALPGQAPNIACIAPLPTGGVLVARHGRRKGPEPIWSVADGQASVAFEMPEGDAQVLSMVAHGDRAYIGTTEGLFLKKEGQPVERPAFLHRQAIGTVCFTGPRVVAQPVAQVAMDSAGNVWLRTEAPRGRGIYTFPVEPGTWWTEEGDQRHEWTIPPLYDMRWTVDPLSLAVGDRAYACFRSDARRPQALLPKLPIHGMTEPFVGDTLLPPVIEPVLAPAADGGVWLAGEADRGAVVLRITDDRVEDHSPPAELIGRSRIVDMAATADRVYLATDRAGVLVFGADGWRMHPVTEGILPMPDMALRAVERVVIDGAGDLWVSSNETLLHWVGDD